MKSKRPKELKNLDSKTLRTRESNCLTNRRRNSTNLSPKLKLEDTTSKSKWKRIWAYSKRRLIYTSTTSRECRVTLEDYLSLRETKLMNSEDSKIRAERPNNSLEKVRKCSQALWKLKTLACRLKEAWLQLQCQAEAWALHPLSVRTHWSLSLFCLDLLLWQRKAKSTWQLAVSRKHRAMERTKVT